MHTFYIPHLITKETMVLNTKIYFLEASCVIFGKHVFIKHEEAICFTLLYLSIRLQILGCTKEILIQLIQWIVSKKVCV